MADDDESDAVYRRQLSEVLRSNEFGWVVDQAERHIAEGKPSSKQVSERESFVPSSDSDFAIRPPRSRRASLVTSEPYSEEEQLDIVVGAIEEAIVQRATLETALLDLLSTIAPVASINFQPDTASGVAEGGQLRKSHRIDAARRDSASNLRQRALAALANIRRRDRAHA